MAVLVDYRSDLFNNLAATADAAKWTPLMLDGALRLALEELNTQLVYEASFTVVSTGYQQDLSSITAIHSPLAVAYPWVEGSDFGRSLAQWRLIGPNIIYLTHLQASAGEVMRVRYNKYHAIQNLDSAPSTTVPDASRTLVSLWATAHLCEMRYRLAGEKQLGIAAQNFRQRAREALSHIPPLGRVRWGSVGLE